MGGRGQLGDLEGKDRRWKGVSRGDMGGRRRGEPDGEGEMDNLLTVMQCNAVNYCQVLS